jgi:hypothetical protein
VLTAKNLLVIGIHREELSFGEHVAEQINKQQTQVLRISHGISRQRNPQETHFYYTTRHREIYLQLRQQVKGRYGLIIDLHSGFNESGRCADVYCHNEDLLDCLDVKTGDGMPLQNVRSAHIVADLNTGCRPSDTTRKNDGHFSHAIAHTLIPEEVWDNRDFMYVGIEIYLNTGDAGTEEDWIYARNLIGLVLRCAQSLAIDAPNRSSYWTYGC